ncbi:MAG TPA: lamin tail domain-containing protein, partial [Verrucomicrobiae bacterium]
MSFLAAVICTARANLPPGWTDADIGSPADAGSATDVNGGWSLSGGGVDIGGTSDQFNFASQICDSDGAVVALVTSVQNADASSGWAKIGVMFRNDATPGAANACMVSSYGKGVQFQFRSASGTGSSGTEITGISPPVWIKVVRSSDLFSGYYSTDGTNWVQVGATQTILMSGTALAGLGTTAHNNSALNRCTATNVSVPSTTFGIYRQYWDNLNQDVGDTLDALTNTTDNPNWPNNPVASNTHIFTNFETEISSGVNYYGQRLRAYVVPPLTGSYTFWIASDDLSDLFLSASENPTSARLIAQETSWNDSEDWTQYASQQSAPVTLQAGSRYYLEAQMQQGNGGDNLSVRWELPDGNFEQPMAAVSAEGTIMIPYTGIAAFPGIYSQTTNVSAIEGTSLSLSVLVTNQSAVTYQWFGPNGSISGATTPVYNLSNLNIATNNGQIYTCVVGNSLGSVTSAPIALTISSDTTPPVVLRVINIGLTNVEVDFSKPIAVTSATDSGDFVFTNGLDVVSANLSSSSSSVILTTAPLVYGSNYSIVINNIFDTATIPNEIATNTLVSFIAEPLASQDIGNPPVSTTENFGANGVTITGDGAGIGGNTDQANLTYQIESGNFDIALRVGGMEVPNVFAQAGLMGRASLAVGSPYAAALASPGVNGDSFSYRGTTNGAAAVSGHFPVNYPNTWLRLSRSGNVFTGFGSYDGTHWTQLGSATIAMPSQIYVGLALASGSANAPVTASFANFGATPAGAVLATQTNPNEPLGPSSRTTGIAISEIMWKPAARADSNDVEFIELYNSCPFFQDISSYTVKCVDMSYTFAPNTTIGAGQFFVLAASPPAIAGVYGLTSNVFGYTGSLKHSETLQLLDERSNVLLTVPYTDVYPWPVAAGGTGHSIVLANPTYGEGDPRAWAISDHAGGSPGQMDSFTPSPLRSVVINEILA